MAKLPILDREGKESGSVDLPDEIFTARINTRVIHQAMVMYHASERQGTASTKQRAEVRGGGKKPWRQKGSGRARHGSSRSPLWRGGGVTFGPQPRDFGYSVPTKIRSIALRESLSAKFQSSQLTCLDDIKEDLNKTKEFFHILNNLKINGSILAIFDGCSQTIQRVSRNIPSFDIKRACDVNAFDIVRHKNVLVSKSSIEALLKRVQK